MTDESTAESPQDGAVVGTGPDDAPPTERRLVTRRRRVRRPLGGAFWLTALLVAAALAAWCDVHAARGSGDRARRRRRQAPRGQGLRQVGGDPRGTHRHGGGPGR